jgi:hypothetical protein
VFVFNHYRPINGKEAKQNPHSERRSLLARAGECRALAAGLNDAAAREVMLRAAVDYEVLAERLQRVAET